MYRGPLVLGRSWLERTTNSGLPGLPRRRRCRLTSMNRFAVSSDRLIPRLARFDLDARSRQVIEWYSRRHLHGAVLFVDEPWAELDYEELATDEGVALAVFAAPVEVDGGIALTNEILLGDRIRRDTACFVFLDVLRCRDLALVPDAHALFTGGLEVARLACFAAPDATAVVGKRLQAKIVLSGLGDAEVELAKGTLEKVEHFVDSRRKLETVLRGPLAAVASRFEDEERAWEIALDVALGDAQL
jgi:hypothetical protein